MDYTSNYRLKLPAKTDVIDSTVLNSNFSAVDTVFLDSLVNASNIQPFRFIITHF